MIGIYKITSPSKKVYIGQSINIQKRWNQYRNNLAKGQRYLNYSFIKYGVENHSFEVVEECDKDSLNNKERHYQELFNAMGKKGLNLVLTESNEKPRVFSEYFSKNLSEMNRKRIWTDESKLKLSEKAKVRLIGNSFKKNFKHSQEFKENRSRLMMGNKITLGYKQTEEAKAKISENNFNKILLLDTQTGVFYNSIKEAAPLYGYKSNTLAMKLKGYKNKKNNTPLIIV